MLSENNRKIFKPLWTSIVNISTDLNRSLNPIIYGLTTKTERKHPFPYRTRKLSSLVIWIVLSSDGKFRKLPTHFNGDPLLIKKFKIHSFHPFNFLIHILCRCPDSVVRSIKIFYDIVEYGTVKFSRPPVTGVQIPFRA